MTSQKPPRHFQMEKGGDTIQDDRSMKKENIRKNKTELKHRNLEKTNGHERIQVSKSIVVQIGFCCIGHYNSFNFDQ